MGGLVIKKVRTSARTVEMMMASDLPKQTYLLAIRDPTYQQIAKRIHSMFFLASPHRGADSARLLNSLLRASILHGPRQYVSEIIPHSGSLQVCSAWQQIQTRY